ncbi:MAG: NADH-quinone oxidoreductase subunit M [Planctomycetes bacterium]|nr:NADH-quinone oxidoreductase subunit M [Planctomycetota bacterium]
MLALLCFLPLAGALLLLCLPRASDAVLRLVALGVTLVVAGLGLALFLGFDGELPGFQAEFVREWFALAGPDGTIPVRLHLGLDGVSLLLVALTALLMPLVVLSSYGHVHTRVKEFLLWLLVMETGMLGVFLALDLVLFYFFWELSLVPLYFLVGIWGGERRLYATIKFFLYTVAGSLVMLVAVIALIWKLGSASVPDLFLHTAALEPTTQAWIFAAFALAFAIKVPLLPFHTWLADAHTEAPTSGSVLLAGVLLKMGTYGLLRFGIQLFPAMAIDAAPVFLALGAFGIVYGALLAMAQDDLKRLIACSSVSHLGFVVLGLFALNSAGLRGAVLQMINHGLSTGLLFLLVGMVYERTHTRQLERYGGLAAVMPVFALFFVFTVLSSVGLPGLNGFVGEYLILAGTFEVSPAWATLGVSGVVLGAVYLLTATRRMLFGPVVHAENRKLADLGAREVGLMLPLVALSVWIGVQPSVLLDKCAPALERILERVEDARFDARLANPAAEDVQLR